MRENYSKTPQKIGKKRIKRSETVYPVCQRTMSKKTGSICFFSNSSYSSNGSVCFFSNFSYSSTDKGLRAHLLVITFQQINLKSSGEEDYDDRQKLSYKARASIQHKTIVLFYCRKFQLHYHKEEFYQIVESSITFRLLTSSGMALNQQIKTPKM